MRPTILLLFLIFKTTFLRSGNAGNILFLAPLASPSHHNWNRNIYLEMVRKGHNVTVLSPDADQETIKNLHYIKTEGVYEGIHNSTEESVDLIEFAKMSEWSAFKVFWHWCSFNSRLVANSKGFQVLLNYPNNFKFDLIVDDFTMGPFMLGFLHKFNYPPAAAITPFGVPHYFTKNFGGHRQPAYIPHHGSRFSEEMSFFERIYNYLFYLIDDYYYHFHVFPEQDRLMKDTFGYQNMPDLIDIQERLGLALVNVHPAVESYFPLPSNMIAVGGLQIRDAKPLDPDVKTFIEAGKKGTVLFSLGTNVKSEMLDDKMKEMFISVFSELPEYNFLWKYESDLKISLPKNVMIRAWLKQNDILAHTNLKAFISHCGLMSTQEATWHGVPVLGFPFFADQRRNAVGLVGRGTGIHLDIFTITHEKFKNALLEILENPKFTKNAQERARVFQDQPEKPLDRAIFWLEWAMRHKNDLYVIQSPVKKVGSFVGNGYDMVVLGLTLFLIVLIVVQKGLKILFSFKGSKGTKKEKLN